MGRVNVPGPALNSSIGSVTDRKASLGAWLGALFLRTRTKAGNQQNGNQGDARTISHRRSHNARGRSQDRILAHSENYGSVAPSAACPARRMAWASISHWKGFCT